VGKVLNLQAILLAVGSTVQCVGSDYNRQLITSQEGIRYMSIEEKLTAGLITT
jgi:hypothetical protein